MTASVPVSVIVPARNAAAHLAAALENVVGQHPRPAEIFVIDGDSADDTVAIAKGFAGVQVIGQTGLGLAGARNEAIRHCRQPFIAFCDADDRWTAGALEALFDALTAAPGALTAVGLVVRDALEGVASTAAQQDLIGQAVPGFTPGAALFRRDAFDQLGWFDESLSIGTDSDWFVRLQQSAHPAVLIDTIVLRKGANGASLSTDVATYRRELFTVARRFIDRKRENPE